MVLSPERLHDFLGRQEEIAVMPCSCRATAAACRHPLHGRHESETCFSFGAVAVLHRISGVARKVSVEEARGICQRAVDSGLVHHAILSFGILAEVCNCCPESCAVLAAYHRGITGVVRPSALEAVRTERCNECGGRPLRICVQICPYGHGPGSEGCVGCGLCACRCPRGAIEMMPRGVETAEARTRQLVEQAGC